MSDKNRALVEAMVRLQFPGLSRHVEKNTEPPSGQPLYAKVYGALTESVPRVDINPERTHLKLLQDEKRNDGGFEPLGSLRPYTPSPSENRRFWLEQKLGRHTGRGTDDLLDWVDPITPIGDFAHRREQGTPWGWQDTLEVGGNAAAAIPVVGRPIGKGLSKAGKQLDKAALDRGTGQVLDPSIMGTAGGGGRRIPLHMRSTSTVDDFGAEIGQVLKTGVSSKGKLFREDLGEITIDLGVSGNPNKKFRGGSGLSHIRDKRTLFDGMDGDGFVRQILPKVLTNGKLSRIYGPANGRAVDIVSGKYQATLRLHRFGERETWLLSGFEIKK